MADQNKKQTALLLSARWWTVLAIIMIIPCLPFTQLIAQERVRKPAVAGYFYPKDKEELTKTVDDFISKVKHKQMDGKILGLMSPHAGYVFSGQVAAYSYSQIKDRQYDTVIILGPSHRVYLKGASVGNWDAYATPLGKVTVNKEMVNALLSIGEPFHFVEQAHINEHSVETQIPFLQKVLKKFDIVPIVMGLSSLINCKKISEALVKIAKKRNVLFVASSDMSHFPDYSNANTVDRKTLALIEEGNPDLVFSSEKKLLKKGIPNLSTTLCGLSSVVTVMMTVKQLGGNAVTILHYANSGDISIHGHRETRRVVGYGAVAFYKQ
ncbi:MAG: AmmeMemoRadiSam system protein B [Deltaproteobacteria bacterium]|nr:AmmeMemoRadiSam system protein B [Deltaproteobacteria bacterium]